MYYLFFFNDTATTEIYTLSLHDALPISDRTLPAGVGGGKAAGDRYGYDAIGTGRPALKPAPTDRKSTRLNSSHANISYAVFCLKKKKKTQIVYMPHADDKTDNANSKCTI